MSGQFGTGAEVSYVHFGTSAEMSWVRSVLGPKCLDTSYSALYLCTVPIRKTFLPHKWLLSDKQYGFIGRSTVLQLLIILDDWTSQLDADIQIDVIYTDFEKVFDKVPHHALHSKLLAYGLDNTLIQCVSLTFTGNKPLMLINAFFK